MPKNHKRKGNPGGKFKNREFSIYILWNSLPSIFKGETEENLKKAGFSDPLTLELLALRTQGDFARKFGIGQDTLSDWNKREDLIKELDKVRGKWAQKLTSNVIAALYRKILKEGDASRAKLWLQYIENWSERLSLENTGGVNINIRYVDEDNPCPKKT